ncbi:hypothetical protein, partial [Enterobacter hormaechei]|uniref:hypothetical protein n=2 Tax=Enterobacter hormaechei TaxID=158836 RepID=UPI001C7D8676
MNIEIKVLDQNIARIITSPDLDGSIISFKRECISALSNLEIIPSREGANKQVISSQADSLIKISRIWADFFPANTS